MQKTGWTDYSSFLVWSGKGFHFGCDHLRAVNNHFPVYEAIFGMVTPEQPGDPRASLLLAIEKAVFLQNYPGTTLDQLYIAVICEHTDL